MLDGAQYAIEWQAPLYSGKQMASGDVRILSANKSFLLRKRITEVSMNQRLLQIESNNFMLSAIRFCQRSHVNVSCKKQLDSTVINVNVCHCFITSSGVCNCLPVSTFDTLNPTTEPYVHSVIQTAELTLAVSVPRNKGKIK